jgi:ABC-type branched-subunit amino acid transport system permease subunit
MITVGGLGNNAGAYLGTLLCVSLLKGLNVSKQSLGIMLIGSTWTKVIGYLENIILGGVLLLFLIFKPGGLVPEKVLMIRGVNYREILSGEKESKRL